MDNNNTMEYRIGLEKQNKRNDQVTELILDNCRASQISGLTDEFVNLETLSLINVGLVTLKGFPKLPKLKKLELSDNRLTGGLNLLHGSPKLQHLNISGNRIRDLEALEPLKEFHDLVTLDLYNCEVTKADDYRKKVFELIPNLHSLDGYDRNEREVADSDESDDEASDVENRITRDNNDSDEDEDDEEVESSEYDDEDLNGVGYDEAVDDEGDEDDDDDDEEDDGEDDDENEEDFACDQGEGNTASSNQAAAVNVSLRDESLENGDNDDDDENDDDFIEEIDDEEAGADASDLKQLEKDFGDGDSEDDDDFEPGNEPDARDHEIDPEDDADEDPEAGFLSTSNLNASESSAIEDSTKRGTKRKFEDEGGDEAVDE